MGHGKLQSQLGHMVLAQMTHLVIIAKENYLIRQRLQLVKQVLLVHLM